MHPSRLNQVVFDSARDMVRLAPEIHSATPCPRPARGPRPCAPPPGPEPGPARAPLTAARSLAAPGPRQLYETAAGPTRAQPALSRDQRFARRARDPRGARCGAACDLVVTEAAWGREGDVTCVPRPRRPSHGFCRAQCERWGGRWSPAPDRPAVWKAQHQLALCIRAQAKQVSPNESPVPAVLCHRDKLS